MRRLVFAAIESEIALLKEELRAELVSSEKGCMVYSGRFHSHVVRCCVGGVGVVQAAFSLGYLFSRYPVREAILVGSSGAYPKSGLRVGDLAVATWEAFAEMGVCTEQGLGDAQAMQLEGLDASIPMNPDLAGNLHRAAERIAASRLGGFLTVAGVTGDKALASRRADRFGVIAENMEGYAFALATRRLGVRAGEIRGISNFAGKRDRRDWDLDLAQTRCQQALLEYFREAPWED